MAPKPLKGGGAQKRKTADFHLKSHFARIKSATKFLCVKTVSGKAARHSLASLSVQKKTIGGGRPLLPEILDQTGRLERNRRFSISFRS